MRAMTAETPARNLKEAEAELRKLVDAGYRTVVAFDSRGEAERARYGFDRLDTKIVDRGSITMVVYSAFSAGMVDGVWGQVTVGEIIFLVVFSTIFVVVMLWLTRFTALRLGFNDADMKAIQFCGTKKSLATGLPMASVIFGGASLGLLILPLMIFHQIQLMICSWLAARYAREPAA